MRMPLSKWISDPQIRERNTDALRALLVEPAVAFAGSIVSSPEAIAIRDAIKAYKAASRSAASIHSRPTRNSKGMSSARSLEDDMRVKTASALLALLLVMATAGAGNAACSVTGWTSGQWTRPIFECQDASKPRHRRAVPGPSYGWPVHCRITASVPAGPCVGVGACWRQRCADR